MQFGTNSSRVAKIRWYEASPEAKDLGFPTPFVSRNWDQWEIWPDVGEVQWASRERNDGSFPVPVSGLGKPCGLPEVWARGTAGTPLPIYPRNQFGMAACCGGLLDLLGEPIFGLEVQVGFGVSPVVSATPTGQQWTIDDDLTDTCGTLDLAKKSAYQEPWLWRMLEVDQLDDSNPQRELIFGGEN